MFHLAGLANMLTCFRCKRKIATVVEFTIEHKVAWLNSSDPVRLFFDVDNIAFSHARCNIAAASKPNKRHLSHREAMKEWNHLHPTRNRGKNRSVVHAKVKGPKLDFG